MKNGKQKLRKSPVLILISLTTWICLVRLIIWPWIHQIDKADLEFSVLAHINAGIWWIVILWALHHLCYQIFSLFQNKSEIYNKIVKKPSVAIFFLTCNDFNKNSCESCLKQDYDNYQVYICDDSTSEKYIHEIDRFCKQHMKCHLIRRTHHQGYKAGNINFAMRKLDIEWALLVDADQVLPKGYLASLVNQIPADQTSIAFLQGAHITSPDSENSIFQTALSPEVDFFYSRDLSARSAFGFIPLLGHGALVNKTVWARIGEIPEVVSEDFAFAMRCANNGFAGRYVEHVQSYETYPFDFGGFLIRLRKFSSGTAELIRNELIRFLRGKGAFTEKWDMLLMLIWYMLMPLLVLNGFLGGYVVHRLWTENLSYLHPILPYLYIWMFMVTLSLSISSTKNAGQAIKFYFWSSAIYLASLPLASVSFIIGFFKPPRFDRTPKNAEGTPTKIWDAIPMILLGVLAIYYSFQWLSPFSPVLGGQGLAYICFPLYSKLNSQSALGTFARGLIYFPGILMILALYSMWMWGRY